MNAFASRLVGVAIVALGMLPSPARAVVSSLLTMDDLPNQPIHGLVHPSGVTFGFTIGGTASLDARYNSGGPGTTTFINDPSIEGPTSAGASNAALSLIFNPPVTSIDFGLAMSWNATIPAGVIVQLFDASNALSATSQMSLEPLPTFSEGFYAYTGPPVRRAVVNLRPPQQNLRFVIDDLGFTAVPEPSTLSLIVVAMMAAASVTSPRRASLRFRSLARQKP